MSTKKIGNTFTLSVPSHLRDTSHQLYKVRLPLQRAYDVVHIEKTCPATGGQEVLDVAFDGSWPTQQPQVNEQKKN